MKPSAAIVLAVLIAIAVSAAGCGGGSSSTAPEGASAPPPRVTPTPGAGKKATAPNAPAGSAVVSCAGHGGATSQLRATAVDCAAARATVRRWETSAGCALPRGASRGSCSLGDFRCQVVRVDRGAAVSCARQGADVAFIAAGRPLRKSGAG